MPTPLASQKRYTCLLLPATGIWTAGQRSLSQREARELWIATGFSRRKIPASRGGSLARQTDPVCEMKKMPSPSRIPKPRPSGVSRMTLFVTWARRRRQNAARRAGVAPTLWMAKEDRGAPVRSIRVLGVHRPQRTAPDSSRGHHPPQDTIM